ncbi:hypothetical protein C9374_010157 [Naegleria lovaniensis]|uniref:Uncharacterized protein n=1 Tax=Naegleria lovaniensis TaxID=51637 RepID=A0AA88KEM4_NAELO|nr:uncharacterized protein C9374_010157 [Naegleria lovaniensis]KAG2375153.1 hypothetical protein C9374_010157 [Naegleria lovaniensis]
MSFQNIRDAFHLFSNDKVLQAHDLLIHHFGPNFKTFISKVSDQDLVLDSNDVDMIRLIYRDGALAKMLLHEFNCSDGWNLCVDKDRAKTYYKRSGQVSQQYFGTGTNSSCIDGVTDDAPLHVIKIEGEIDAPIFNLLSI